MRIVVLSIASALPFFLAACDRTGPASPPDTVSTSAPANNPQMGRTPTQNTQSSTPQASRPSDPTVASFLGLEGPKPATWQWQPPRNPMITANYTVPAPSGIEGARAAHLNIYYFGEGMGGPIEDNIDRWKNQFRSPDGYEVTPIVDEFEVDSMPITYVELAGEWMQMGAVSFTRDQLFLAAIIDAPAGRIFLRFAGDEKTVEANREAFMKLLHGLRRVDGAEVNDPGAPYDNPVY